jgi:PqqD family protein of HPr-rel-A system
MVLVSSHRKLIWQKWDDIYIVYQSSSAETHVFNETTALILRILEQGQLTAETLRHQTEAAIGLGEIELIAENFAFATMRLEELGLIECLDDASAVR